MGVPKFPQLGLLWLWRPITLHEDLQLRWGLGQSYSRRWEFLNGMLHTNYMQGNRGDSWLLMVKSQIPNLTPDLFFVYNLCVKCPNGSCEPILDIYVLGPLQWYKRLFNLMDFDPCNYSLKIRESIWTLTPKVGAYLGVWGFMPSHSLTLPGAWNVTLGLHIWPIPSQALALVASLRLGLWHS